MVATCRLITSGVNLHTQSTAAFRTEPGWIKFAPTGNIGVFDHRGAAPTAVRVVHSQMALDSAPIWLMERPVSTARLSIPVVIR
jgi:hypothetical protein